LMKSIYLIDCPGVVYPSGDTETEIVLKGVVRVENIPEPEEHVAEILKRVKKEYIYNTYKIENWEDHFDFLTQYARNCGKLLKGGEPDLATVAKMILNDWQRGKIPYFVSPQFEDNLPAGEKPSGEAFPVVTQKFRNIRVVNSFIGEDNKKLEEEEQVESETPDWDQVYQSENEDVENEESEEGVDENEDDNEAEDEENEEDDENPTFDSKEEGLSLDFEDSEEEKDDKKSKKRKAVEVEESSEEEETEKKKKQLRMTTNKKKIGVHYYDKANVKNRNRKKTKTPKHQVMREVSHQKKKFHAKK